MREYKFRGKIIDHRTRFIKTLGYKVGDWIYGENISTEHDDIEPDKIHVFICGIRVDPDTVGQCIGLEDCDGSKVYEGDIVQDLDDAVLGVVYWDKDQAGFMFEFDTCLIEGTYSYCYPVVGNKWDNPELLEQWECQKGNRTK